MGRGNYFSTRELRTGLTFIARERRQSAIPEDTDLKIPQSQRTDEVFFENKVLKRKRIVLLSPGCSIATCTMCPLPSEALDGKRNIQPDDIIAQFESVFKNTNIDDFDMITIYNNGNFFVDQEVPAQVRRHIYKRVAKSKAKILTVESLPQFITGRKMAEAKYFLRDKKLSVSIGLQSANDQVRELAVNSTCTKKGFEKGVKRLKDSGYLPQVFLMIKPPFLTEEEGIKDAIDSIRYLASLDINNPILCPTRVSPNTVLELIHSQGKFRPPWLWSIIEILKKCSDFIPESRPRVVVSELKQDQNPDSVCAQNCVNCNDQVIGAISRFNFSRNVIVLDEVGCRCKKTYLREMLDENATKGRIALKRRVEIFLDKQNSHTVVERNK